MEKLCKACDTIKPLDEFTNHKGKTHGKGAWCKPCAAAKTKAWREQNPEKVRQYRIKYQEDNPLYASRQSKRWRERNPEARRSDHLRRHYGIEVQDYDRLLKEQNGRCAICGTTESDSLKQFLCVDHIDSTCLIRGLLCSTCNSAIGLLHHSEELLQSAITYLRNPPVMEGIKVPQGIHRSRLVEECQDLAL